MSAAPLVSVVMPVYNGERYLEEAIESILNQTFSDFEFIIIDDGSTDGTSEILARYQQIDDRIRVYRHENQGVTTSRNRGCHLAQGKYVAVMDADDISLPWRLARQVDYMEAHPVIGVLGTWMETIDENGVPQRKHCMPVSPSLIGWHLICWDCLIHSSVMMRRDVVERLSFYRPEALLAEDYDLWARASRVTRIANIPEVLLRYRVWEGRISIRRFETIEEYASKVSYSMITGFLGSEVSAEASAGLRRTTFGLPLARLEQIEQVAILVQQLYWAYCEANSPNRMEVKEIAHDVGTTLLSLALTASKISPWKGFAMVIQALRFNPQLLLSRRVVTAAMRKVVGTARLGHCLT